MATYVLVHGGGHGGWCYERVARLLRGAGNEVHAPTLTGLADRSHLLSVQVDLEMHITDVDQWASSTASTSPHSRAVATSTVAAPSPSHAARCRPIRRATLTVPPEPGTRPSGTSGS